MGSSPSALCSPCSTTSSLAFLAFRSVSSHEPEGKAHPASVGISGLPDDALVRILGCLKLHERSAVHAKPAAWRRQQGRALQPAAVPSSAVCTPPALPRLPQAQGGAAGVQTLVAAGAQPAAARIRCKGRLRLAPPALILRVAAPPRRRPRAQPALSAFGLPPRRRRCSGGAGRQRSLHEARCLLVSCRDPACKLHTAVRRAGQGCRRRRQASCGGGAVTGALRCAMRDGPLAAGVGGRRRRSVRRDVGTPRNLPPGFLAHRLMAAERQQAAHSGPFQLAAADGGGPAGPADDAAAPGAHRQVRRGTREGQEMRRKGGARQEGAGRSEARL